MFERFGIEPTLLNDAGVHRVTHREAHESVGIRYQSEHLEGVAFPYRHPDTGQLWTTRVRRDHPECRPDGTPIGKYLCPPDRHHLYFPPNTGPLLADTSASVVLVEAEKSALALTAAADRAGRRVLVIATGGCWGWTGRIGKTTDADGVRVDEKGPVPDLDLITWEERDVVVMLDANVATNPNVRAARAKLSAHLKGRGAVVRVATVPPQDGINGPDDYRAVYGDDALLALVDSARSETDPSGSSSTGAKSSQATELIRLALTSRPELFHDDDRPYVAIAAGPHRGIYELRSGAVRAWLIGLLFDETGHAPSQQSVTDATNTLEAHAIRGPERAVHVRITRDGDAIHLDLGGPDWRVVEVTAAGWHVTNASRVAFRRPPGLLSLPEPVRDGSISELRPFLNVPEDRDWILIVAWLLGALRGCGPYPLLIAQGEQDSGKSSAARVLRTLIDPNMAPLRSETRDTRDLMIAADNAHVLNFDNLSGVSKIFSDDLCRLATGAGFATRALYKNREEEIFAASRPVILNGIADLATRADLVSRALFIGFPPLEDRTRRTERELKREFSAAHPRILGALLDAVALALAREHTIELPGFPRMADFAQWVVAAEPACPWARGAFLDAYVGNRQAAIENVLEGDVVADLAQSLCVSGSWTGTATDFLAALHAQPDGTQRRLVESFTYPRQAADALRRLAPALRSVGMNVRFDRKGKGRTRMIQLTRLAPASSASSAGTNIHDISASFPADASADARCVDTRVSSAGSSAWTGRPDDADAADARTPGESNEEDEWTVS
jgi:hypothetical protein